MGQMAILLLYLFNLALQVNGRGYVQDVIVDAKIRHRYATTRVSTTLYNQNTDTATLRLYLSLPSTALLSALDVEMNGQNYSGQIYDRSGASALFQEVTQQGKMIASLHHRDDNVQEVEMETTVGGLSYITFHTTYEDLVRRIDGTYQYTLPLYPGQHVPRVEISVHVIEQEDIKDYWIPSLPGQEMTSPSHSTSVTGGPKGPNELHIKYLHQDHPHAASRRINGSFTLAYTTVKKLDGGSVQREGSFFAHYFSPEPMTPLKTHTVYVLDVSYSMRKTRLPELQGALSAALHSIHKEDSFEILVFSSDVVSLGTYSGRLRSVRRAVKRIMRLEALGNSDLCAALLQALKNAANHGGDQIYKQIVVFSDGIINSGDTDIEVIQRKVTAANTDQIPINGFVFHEGSTKVLRRITSDNRGFIRVASPSTSLAKQIQAFLWTVVRPLVAGVEAQYPGVVLDSLVRSGTMDYYYGTELIFVGKLIGGPHSFQPTVTGLVGRNLKQLPVSRIVSSRSRPSHNARDVNVISRLWAYLKLQDLLSKADSTLNDEEAGHLHSEARRLAQQFGFVTQLTSLVAKYPDATLLLTQSNELESDNEGPAELVAAAYRRPGRSYMHENKPHTVVDLAPHFLVHADGIELPLCFYLNTNGQSYVNLINDPLSGIKINGHITSQSNRPYMTYFDRLYMNIGGVMVTISTERIEVDCQHHNGTAEYITKSLWPYYKKNGRRYKYREDRGLKKRKSRRTRKQRQQRQQIINNLTHKFNKNNIKLRKSIDENNIDDDDIYNCRQSTTWRRGISQIYGDLMMVMSSRRHLQLTVGDGLADMRVILAGNRRYLGFEMKQEQIFSSETQGIIGNLMSKSLRLLSERPATNENNSRRVQVEVRNGNNRGGTGEAIVPGSMMRNPSLLNNKSDRCIKVNPQYSPLLPTSPSDYILQCLAC